ncbi:MAG TPA: hypothetical protein VEQ40_01955 [Pyrinomonadaceae bacterium]|nr:hypothetical protein [Pyrinomonadaceae bacterium]
MKTIRELIAQAEVRDSSGGETDDLVKLRGDEDTRLVLYLLLDYLGQDDNRRGVHLDVQGEGQHYLSRTSLLKAAGVKKRSLGFDTSGGFQLPGGGNDRLIKLCCKKQGCTRTFYVINFDEDNPPPCDKHGAHHTGTYMEPCK